jgi:hypothetical protein
MSNTASHSVQEPKKEKAWLTCQRCEKSTLHTTLTIVGESDETPDEEIQFWSEYMTVVCNGCNSISFCIASSCSEFRDPETGKFDVSYKYYPHRVEGKSPTVDVRFLASHIREIYEETHSALLNDLRVLAAIGMRAIIEAVCKHKGYVSGSLPSKINSLASDGLICKDNKDFLLTLKVMGDEGAHEVKAADSYELDAAFGIVEHLLRTVYVLPKLAARMRP